MRVQSLAVLILAIAGLGGCTCADTVSQTRFSCEDAAECLPGFACRGGECRPEDIPPGTCFEGETKACATAGCQSGCGEDGGWLACAPASGPGFETNRDHCGACGVACSGRLSGLLCIAGRCTCVVDSDCPSGDLCGPGGVCVMDTDPCAKVACAAGTVCRDGACAAVGCDQGCRPGEVCGTGGQCRPLLACRFAVPCPDGGLCEGGPQPDGEPCDDGAACTFADQCSQGSCQGTPYTCPAPGPCQESVACAGDGGCLTVNRQDGTSCDDGVACSAGDACQAGACVGAPYTCTADQCSASSECAGDGGCLVTAKQAGAACDDQQPCSFGDSCSDAGLCQGTTYACPGVTACKEAGVCLGDGGCDVVNKANGTSCDDGLACTASDVCTNGACAGAAVTSFRDVDGDGRGSSSATQQVCPLTAGYVLDGGDCNDLSAFVQDALPAVLDVDRDGVTASTTLDPAACVGATQAFGGRTYYRGVDGGYPWLAQASATADCDDADPDVFSSRAMVLLDADRDGYTTGAALTACVGASSLVSGRTYYANAAGAFVYLDVSAALGSGDCNDADPDVFVTRAVALDADRDSFTTTTTTSSQCTGASSVINTRTYFADATGAFAWLGAASATTDCNDANASVLGAVNYYADGDADSFGAGAATPRCAPLAGEVTNNTDCNDTNANVFTTRAVATDADRDSFTTTTTTSSQCTGASSTSSGRTYFNDSSGAATWLGVASAAVDCNDASNLVLGPVSYWVDADNDSFGSSAATPNVRCAPVGQEVTNNTDCNDATSLEYRSLSVALDQDQDGYATTAAAATCVGASSTVGGRVYYYEVAVAGNFYLLGTQVIATSDCAPTNNQLVAGQNNVLTDNDRDGYPFPNDTAQNVACAGPAVLVGGRTYYSNGTTGWWLARTDCINRSGNNCPDIDCLDSNASVFLPQAVVRDQDRDGFTASATLASQCVGAASLFSGRTYYADTTNVATWSSAASASVDCYDANVNAKPGQTAFFTAERGDGSFDYDCSGAVTANTAASYCSATAAGTQAYTDGSCAVASSLVTLCTSAAQALPAACGKPTVGSGVFVLSASVCTAASQASSTLVGCR